MADEKLTFSFDLDPSAAKGGANELASTLDQLQGKIDDDTAALGRMQKAMKSLQGGASVDIAAFRSLQKQIDSKKNSIAGLNSKFIELGGTFKKTAKPAQQSGDRIKELFEKMQKGGGPVGGLAGKLGGLRTMLASGGMIAGPVAIAGALLAMSAAITVATLALLKYGLAAADARRSEALALEGLTKVRNWYGIAAGKASDLQGAIDRVSDSLSSGNLGRDQVGALAKGLYQAHFRGKALEQALEGLATVSSAAGEEQAAMYKQMMIGAGRAHGSIKKVTDDIKARFGDIAEAQALSLPNQLKRLKQGFDELFAGLKIEGFLKGLHKIGELFSQSTASGRALKQILTVVLQPLIGGATAGTPIIRRFFQGMILGAQFVVMGALQIALAWRKAFGKSELFKNLDLAKGAMYAGMIVAGLFAAAVVGLGVSIAGIVAQLALLAAAIAYPIILVYRVGKAIYTLVTRFDEVGAALAKLDWGKIGVDVVKGFADGIRRGVGFAVDAVKGLAKAAKDALLGALDSHSPSRLFRKAAFTAPMGVVVAMREGQPIVRKASAALAFNARAGFEAEQAKAKPANDNGRRFGGVINLQRSSEIPDRPSAGSAPPPAAGAVQVTVGPITINSQATDAAGLMRDLEPEIVRAFTKVAIGMGARRG